MSVTAVSTSVTDTVELSDGRPFAFVVEDEDEEVASVLRCMIGGGGLYSTIWSLRACCSRGFFMVLAPTGNPPSGETKYEYKVNIRRK